MSYVRWIHDKSEHPLQVKACMHLCSSFLSHPTHPTKCIGQSMQMDFQILGLSRSEMSGLRSDFLSLVYSHDPKARRIYLYVTSIKVGADVKPASWVVTLSHHRDSSALYTESHQVPRETWKVQRRWESYHDRWPGCSNSTGGHETLGGTPLSNCILMAAAFWLEQPGQKGRKRRIWGAFLTIQIDQRTDREARNIDHYLGFSYLLTLCRGGRLPAN